MDGKRYTRAEAYRLAADRLEAMFPDRASLPDHKRVRAVMAHAFAEKLRREAQVDTEGHQRTPADDPRANA